MKRTSIRILFLAVSGFISGGMLSACASEEPSLGAPPDAGNALGAASSTGGAANTCAAMYCPAISTGTACCISAAGPCGVDYGMGCVHAKDGG